MKNRLVIYCCENSAMKAVSAAGALDSVDIIKLPCSGRVEAGLILKSFEKGYGGVVVLGCPLDNCTFIRGNYRARKRVSVVKKSLREAGINENRVKIDFVSSVDTHKVIAIVEEMKAFILTRQSRFSPLYGGKLL